MVLENKKLGEDHTLFSIAEMILRRSLIEPATTTEEAGGENG